MESRIPLPTDNIYKFCALFGLLLAIFSIGSIVYVNKSANDLVFSSIVELEQLKQIEEPSVSEKARLNALNKQLEIAGDDKKVFMNALAVFLVVGMYTTAYGFWRWRFHIQPMQDELLRLQIQKLKLEVRPRWKN